MQAIVTNATVLIIEAVVLTFCLDTRLIGQIVANEASDYNRSVKPVLQERCFACHGAFKQEGGLRVDTVQYLIAGGDSGPAVRASDAASSLLMQRIRHPIASSRMPPEGMPLTEMQIQAIESWIESGASGPADEQPQHDPREHWAYQLPRRPELPIASFVTDSPASQQQQVSNPIDRLLSAKHQQLGIQPLPSENYRTLVRRVYIDLLGLPPTPQQLHVALNDLSPNAYETLVDQLLSQVEYGERWGRHWMDVWRYSDWYGRRSVPDVMNSYPQIWRWRDWIVRSLNEDKGYDQMILEMLAADELLPTDDQNVVATGFLVRNWYKWNYETWLKDNVEHTSKSLLGLTMNCAHCHDHKYDPITQEDYFRFQAFFAPLELRHDRVSGESDPGPFKKYVYAESYGPIKTGAIRVFDEKLDAKTFLYVGGDSRNRVEGKPPLEPSPPVALTKTEFAITPVNLPSEAFYPGLKEFVRNEEREKVAAEFVKAKTNYEQVTSALHTASKQALLIARLDTKAAFAALLVAQARQSSIECRIAADDARFRGLGDAEDLARRAHQAEKQLDFEVAQQAEVEAQRTLVIASHQVTIAAPDARDQAIKQEAKAIEALQAARMTSDTCRKGLLSNEPTYTPLSPIYPSTSTGRRSALARWIANDQNPLTARVAINHIWLRHFGQALVESTDNMGVQGKRPLHPEILDWLAVELMENGWSMKHIHRVIVTSQAYRRSSNPPPDHSNFRIDRDNQYYWRSVPQRMQAETVRDSVLACAGALEKTQGGQEIDNTQWVSSTRRSLYFTIHGESKMQFLDIFDGPNVCDCYRRTSTVMPQQALAMTNSELLVSNGRKLATKITEGLCEVPPTDLSADRSDSTFVQRVFETILSRPANDEELRMSLEFLNQQRILLEQAGSDLLAKDSSKEVVPASKDPIQRARENLAISLFSHNDFVTVR